MIAVGLRLALATRRARIRLALTAFAVAAGVVLVLGAFAVPAAHDQSRLREALLSGASGGAPHSHPAILWNSRIAGVFDGNGRNSVRVVGAGPSGPGAPALPGGAALPRPGRMLVSPALGAALRGRSTGQRLTRQLPLPVVGEVPAQLLPHPDDLVAIVGQTPASLTDSGTRIATWRLRDPASYLAADDSPVSRIIRLLTPVIILVPILVLVATAARIGRRRRDGQLAALRLIGASTRQLALIATTEAIVASVVGAALGGALFATLVRTLTTIHLPTETLVAADLVPPGPAIVAALVGIPVAAAASVLLTVGRALAQPLAVRRSGAPARPGIRRFAPLALGWAGLIACHWIGRGGLADALLVASGTALVLGVVLAGPWLVRQAASGLMLAFGGRPAALIGGRRLLSDSAGGFRAVTGIASAAFVLTAVAVWFAGVTALEARDLERFSLPEAAGLASVQLSRPSDEARAVRVVRRAEPDTAILRGFYEERSGALIFFADCDALRRRIPIAVDCSTPLASPGRSDLVGRELRLGGSNGRRGSVRIERPAPLPDAARAALGGDALLPLAAAPAGLTANDVRLILPSSSADRAAGALLAASIPAFTYAVGSGYSSGLDSLTVGLRGIVLLSFLLGAISLAVGGADDMLERRHELARLQASGVGVGTLRAVTALEQLGPLVLGVVGATSAGLAVGSTFVMFPPDSSSATPLVVPWGQLAVIGALAVAAGAIVLAATLPTLGRAIRPDALRVE